MKNIEMKSKETLTSRQEEVLKLYKNLNSQNKHKMSPVPVCKVPKNLKNSIEF
jgi:NAD+ synthase